jgi:uncharacterized protein YndB with AHSA1/START domain
MAHTLRVERTYEAPARAVFDTWTSPEVMRRWWHAGDASWERRVAEADLRVGGAYRVTMRAPGGAEYTSRGDYTVVDSPRRLAFHWTWDGDHPNETLRKPARTFPMNWRPDMSDAYTVKNLTEVEDSAPKFGFEDVQEARFARGDLDAEHTGISHLRVKAGKRQAFAHRHDAAEEIYVVLSGSGRVKLDDDILEISPRDALRVAPGVIRQFEAGPDGLELLAVGARHDADGEVFPGWWSDGA